MGPPRHLHVVFCVCAECVFTHDMPWSRDDQLDIRHSTRLVLAVVAAHLVAGTFCSATGSHRHTAVP